MNGLSQLPPILLSAPEGEGGDGGGTAAPAAASVAAVAATPAAPAQPSAPAATPATAPTGAQPEGAKPTWWGQATELAQSNARLEQQLAEERAKHEAATRQLAEMQAAQEAAAAKVRDQAIVSKVSERTTASSTALQMLMAGARAEGKLKDLPKDPDKAAEKVVSVLSEAAPNLFKQTRTTGGGAPQKKPAAAGQAKPLRGFMESPWAKRS